MKRRSLFKMLAGLPFLGFLKPKESFVSCAVGPVGYVTAEDLRGCRIGTYHQTTLYVSNMCKPETFNKMREMGWVERHD